MMDLSVLIAVTKTDFSASRGMGRGVTLPPKPIETFKY